MKKLLSKSSINLYLQCPFKWKLQYIDLLTSKSSSAQERGIKIHKKIEEFYKNPKVDQDLKNFISLELKRIKSCFKNGKLEKKYFYPLFQELKLQDEELGLKGIIDAVYINPEDDGIIVMDWKTGKFDKNKLDDYRLELAIYVELLRASGKVDSVDYWALYFTDQDKLFFEKIDKKYINKMYKIVNDVREKIEECCFEPRKNIYCYSCEYKDKCKNDRN
jgi:putative RecB family exonuclease